MGTLRITTAGESHGPAEVCIVEGLPAGLEVDARYIEAELGRRRRGYGRGGRMALEPDSVRVLAGVRLGRTLGSPVCLVVENKDHVNWLEEMSPFGQGEGRRPVVTVPRPGHADLAGVSKFGFCDIRNVLERASARETVARVAGGALCKLLLGEVGVVVKGRVVAIGEVAARTVDYMRPQDVDWEAVENSPVACDDAEASSRMCEVIDKARTAGESLGGVFEIWCYGVCPGVGSYAGAEARLDGRVLGTVASIPGIKGVELGEAFANAQLPGSLVHDAMFVQNEGGQPVIQRRSNHAAGTEGGMTTGLPLVVRAAMKPIPTLAKPLPSVDIATMTPVAAHVERSDVCAVPAARVVAEAVVAAVVAGAYLEKFGGDSVDQFRSVVKAYEDEVEKRGLWRRSSF